MSVSLNPQAIADQVGSAVPTAFLIALLPLTLILGSFVVLTKRRGTAGSVFGFVGAGYDGGNRRVRQNEFEKKLRPTGYTDLGGKAG